MQMQQKLLIFHYHKEICDMFIMKPEEVQIEIDKINNYIKLCSWMDFVLCQLNFGQIELYGAIDQTYNNYVDNYEIKLIFEQPHFISSLFSWQADTSKLFIQLASEAEEIEMNSKYRVEQENYIFKINIDDYENSPIFIAAKKITCEILNENPFPKS